MSDPVSFPDCRAAAPTRNADARGAERRTRSTLLQNYVPAVLLLLGGLAGLGFASVAGASEKGRYVVITAPGTSLADTINMVSAADGRLIQPGRFSNIVIAGSGRPDFQAQLRKSGAWLAVAAPDDVGCTDSTAGGQIS